MVLVRRMDSRRVFVLGLAGLVPAAVVTLLLVHQPSVGARRLYPMLRGPLTVVGFGLVLATLIAWASAPDRLSRSSLSGLAWAGVTLLLCIGPFVESVPRARLFALQLRTGEVAWATSRAAEAPRFVDDVLVVTEEDAGMLVGLEPETGRQMWRRSVDDATLEAPAPSSSAGEITVVDGRIERAGSGDAESWSLEFPGQQVLDVAESGDSAYAYVSAPGVAGVPVGAIVKFATANGEIQWWQGLPESVAAEAGPPAIDANDEVVVVAGGKRIAALDAGGRLLWTQGVASLGKSRSYALPGAIHQVLVSDSLVFLSATADR